MTFAVHSRIAVVAFVGLLGAAAVATVPPLQMWVLAKAEGAGQSLASSFNIAAFNLGNALGALFGGAIIAYGPGLEAVPWIAALIPISAFVVACLVLRLENGHGPTVSIVCGGEA